MQRRSSPSFFLKRAGHIQASAHVVSTRRRRLVTFRLTEPEYEAVKKAYMESGERSISEFVHRAVLNEVSRQGVGRITFADDLNTLTLRLKELDSSIREVSARISRLLGTEATPPGADE